MITAPKKDSFRKAEWKAQRGGVGEWNVVRPKQWMQGIQCKQERSKDLKCAKKEKHLMDNIDEERTYVYLSCNLYSDSLHSGHLWMIHTREKALVTARGQWLPRALQTGTGIRAIRLSAALSFWSLAELSHCWVSQRAYHLLQAGTHAPAARNTTRFQHNRFSHWPTHAFSWSFMEVVFSFPV